jgi:transposase
LKVSSATGAAGTHLGPRALAIAAELNKHRGLSMRKTCAILQTLFGLRLTPGGLSQALDRVAQRLEPEYEALIQELRDSPVAYGDETSWWIGEPAWLWVFATPDLTCYVVHETRAREVITATLGPNFPGVLVSDCLASYDDATPEQHKCYAHHAKAISKAMHEHSQGGQGYLEQVRGVLVAAMSIAGLDRDSDLFRRSYHTLQQQADRLLATCRDQPQEEAVRQRLAKQRDHLFTFLDHEGVDATNNLAERQLRPAVIARKLSCGNKTRSGADTFQILASLAATADQRGDSFLEQVTQACRRSPPTRHDPADWN